MKFKEYISIEEEIISDTLWFPMRNQIGYMVTEILDSDIECKLIWNHKDSFRASFMAINHYNFDAFPLNNNIWGIMFYKYKDKQNPDKIFKSGGREIGASVVMAGVFNCIDLLISKQKVNGIYFQSDDIGLIKFYKKIIPYIEREFKNFVFIGTDEDGNTTSFKFMRK